MPDFLFSLFLSSHRDLRVGFDVEGFSSQENASQIEMTQRIPDEGVGSTGSAAACDRLLLHL
jgi:hypothetical protein